jgi:hypothetical protein
MLELDASIAELAAQLRRSCGALAEDDRSVVPSFWYHRPAENFPPAALQTPEQYRGGDRINIDCGQTALPPKAQRELLSRWCEALPTFRDLRYVWFHSRATQDLFDAACAIPELEGLHIKWSAIEDLEAIASATCLRNFHLGSSPSVKSIEPLARLKNLLRLDLDNVKGIRNLRALGELRSLIALAMTGAEFKRNTVESFAPLGSLRDLKWLHLGSLRTDDMSLQPLGALISLEYLAIGNFFALEEFAWLSVQLPNTTCSWLQPYQRFHKSLFPCPKCQQNWRVMTSGKGGKLLCPTCDAESLAKHVLRFERLKQEVRAHES